MKYLSILLLSLLVAACSKGGSTLSPTSPEAVSEIYIQSLFSGDKEAVKSVIVEDGFNQMERSWVSRSEMFAKIKDSPSIGHVNVRKDPCRHLADRDITSCLAVFSGNQGRFMAITFEINKNGKIVAAPQSQ